MYHHEKVNHSRHFLDYDDTDIHVNTIKRLWRSKEEIIPTNINSNNIELWLDRFRGIYG